MGLFRMIVHIILAILLMARQTVNADFGELGTATELSPPSIPFRPTFGLARLSNSSRPQRTCPIYRNRQPLRRRFIKYHEMGRGRQEKKERHAPRRGNPKYETRNKHEGPKFEFQNGPSERRLSWRGHLALASRGRFALATMATAFRSFGLCISDLFRISTFGFRI
jgi:hypothetical protein